MLAKVRLNEIKKELLIKKSVTVVDMAKHFNVTEETIRRDLKTLEAEGVATRIHGGAALKEKVASSFDRKVLKDIMADGKRGMAKIARDHIANGLCIYMDASSTVQYLIPEIADKRVTIVTNSLDIPSDCAELPNISVVQLGGTLNHSRRCFTGTATCRELNQFHFDLSVISCRTLNKEGFSDADIEESEVKRQAIKHSKRLMVLADHTKFNHISFVKVAELDRADILVTDKPLAAEWQRVLWDKKVEYYCAEDM